jgi:uncharacterized protein YeaO (DUF488 family)
VVPSTELRKWHDHDPARFDEFERRFERELNEPERADALVQSPRRPRRGRCTVHRDKTARDQRGGRAGQVLGGWTASPGFRGTLSFGWASVQH